MMGSEQSRNDCQEKTDPSYIVMKTFKRPLQNYLTIFSSERQPLRIQIILVIVGTSERLAVLLLNMHPRISSHNSPVHVTQHNCLLEGLSGGGIVLCTKSYSVYCRIIFNLRLSTVNGTNGKYFLPESTFYANLCLAGIIEVTATQPVLRVQVVQLQ
ncbi:hypothetical protein D918_00725 [Trichuris suis]|nr:hypothetical protein D918_00725 [Trichuris suis]